MEKTDYTIEKDGELLVVLKFGKMEAKGFNDMNSALHAIYTLEGQVEGDFYIEDEKEIFLIKNEIADVPA